MSMPSGSETISWLIRLPFYLLGLAICGALIVIGLASWRAGDANLQRQAAAAASSAHTVTYENVTAADWGHLPLDVSPAAYNKAKRLYAAERKAQGILLPINSDGFQKD